MNSSRLALRGFRGFGLFAILVLMGLVIMLAASITTRVQFTLSNAPQRESKLQADYAANAGLHRAMVELTVNPDWEPTSAWVGTMSTNTNLGYRVEVVNNRLGTTPRSVSGGPTVPPGRVWLRSTGTVDGEPLGTGIGQAEAFMVRPEPIFNEVLHVGDDEQTVATFPLNDIKVDSFNGEPGGPPPFYIDYLGGGQPPRQEAKIWRTSDFGLGSGAVVDADFASPLTTVQVGQTSGAQWYGQTLPNEAFEAPLVFRKPREFEGQSLATPPPSGSILPGCYGSLYASGDITLSAGTYYFSDLILTSSDLRLDLDTSVSPTAPCVIYVGSMMVFSQSSLINMYGPGDPAPSRQLQIYCTDKQTPPYSPTYVRFDHFAEASCVIAGSLYYQSAGSDGVHLYGALYTKDLGLSDTMGLHYDTALEDQILAGITEWVIVNQGDD